MRIPWRARQDRRKRPVAFVMSGGGPFGAIQVGFIHALISEGIHPDFTVGASVGALNAVFIAHDPTIEGAQQLRDVWLHMRRDDLFPGGKLVSAWHAVRKGSYVFSSAGLRRIIEAELDVTDFEELPIPAHVVAANLKTGAETWFSSGRIVEPLLASSAMPGIFPPVQVGDDTFIDGGIVNNVPVSKAIELGARRIYVLNVTGGTQPRNLQRPHDFVMHGLVLARAQRYRMDIETYREKSEVIEFPSVSVGHVPFTNLSHTPRLIDAGFEAGIKFLRGDESSAREEIREATSDAS